MEHRAFRQAVEADYSLFANTFLDDEQRDAALSDNFDILCLSWNEALASHDTRRYSWIVLRATVMFRTPHRDGRPELGRAAFDTVALRFLTDPDDRMNQVAEGLELFAAMSRLPANQLDVVVQRRLCGFRPEPTQRSWAPGHRPFRRNATPPASWTASCARSHHRMEHPVTGIEDLLSRALLVRERTVPRDIGPYPAPPTGALNEDTPEEDAQPNNAAQDLHALRETPGLHTPPATIVKSVTDQPRILQRSVPCLRAAAD